MILKIKQRFLVMFFEEIFNTIELKERFSLWNLVVRVFFCNFATMYNC